MKALVLSGGHGTRLRPFTSTMPKQLIPVAGRPVLEHVLRTAVLAGATAIGVVVGGWSAAIRREIGDEIDGVPVTYVEQDAPRGLADAVATARPFLGDDDFALFLGDVLVGDDAAAELVALAATAPAAGVLVREVADPRAYGVAVVGADGAVVRLVEKPADPPSRLAVLGVYYLTAAVHASIAALVPSQRGELELTDALQDLVDRGLPVTARRYRGYWQDVGRVQDVVAANRSALARATRRIDGDVDQDSLVLGDVVVEAGAEVRRSQITGPARVGPFARVVDCVVGPGTTVGDGACLRQVQLADSVVLAGTRLQLVAGMRGCVVAPQDPPALDARPQGRSGRLVTQEDPR